MANLNQHSSMTWEAKDQGNTDLRSLPYPHAILIGFSQCASTSVSQSQANLTQVKLALGSGLAYFEESSSVTGAQKVSKQKMLQNRHQERVLRR